MTAAAIDGGYISDDDDIIEIIYHHTPERILCKICDQDLERETQEQRMAHYDRHFSHEERGSPGSTPPVNTSKSNRVPKPSLPKLFSSKGKEKESDLFWYPASETPPPHNFTPGLIPILRRALLKSHAKGSTRRAVLCYEKTVHVSRENWDRGWGCGYRNFLMVCTALMDQQFQPLYFPLLDDPIPPSVKNLQRWIELAWSKGYDQEGASQLAHKLVETHKWIGTGELYVAFVSRGIPVKLADFDLRGGNKGPEVLINWIVQYFAPPEVRATATVDEALRGASPVLITNRMPLILQHKGHSQTIVGYEVSQKGNINLLTFDPSKLPSEKLREAALGVLSLPPSSPTTPSSRRLRDFLHSREAPPKRKAGNYTPSIKGKPCKRVRSDSRKVSADGDLIIIGDSEDAMKSTNQVALLGGDFKNSADVINKFRLQPFQLSRRDQYQILFFPMDDPLDEAQRFSKRHVTSVKIC